MAHQVELLTRAELAERFGKDIRTITNWIAEGLPQRSRNGEIVYSWPDCREWREAQIRTDARLTRHHGGSEDKKLEAAELQLRRYRAEAEMAELEVAERRGQLVTVNYMATEFERIVQSLRAQLLAIPTQWAPRLDKCKTTLDRQLVLREEVNALMPILRAAVEDDDSALKPGATKATKRAARK